MKTSHQDLMADDAMFFGLEELDGNAYKLSKTETGSYEFDDSFCLPESNSNEDSDDKLVNVDFSIGHTDDNTKSKKNKKKKTLSDDNKKGDESLENSVDVISKKNSKKKQKVDEEVLDGIDAVEAIPGKAKTKKDKKKKKSKENIKEDMDVDTAPVLEPDDHLELWGASEVATGVEVHQLIYEALVKLNYVTPTAIQQQAIPVTLKNSIVGSSSDIVGAAETGSGKTLAFVIPIIHSLLLEYSEWHNEDFVHHYKRNIYSLIIAPTRELALQIAGVANDIPKQFSVNDKDVHSSLQRPIGIVSLTGGLSEHKQKRQLYNGMYSKNPRHFVHMIVATPGRFCELLTASNQTNNSNVFNVASSSSSNNDIDISSIVDSGLTHEGDNDMLLLCRQNWRKLRFLVVDEADRLVEEGHFPELDRILEFIKPTVNKGRNTDPMRDVTADADGVEHEEIPECETALRQTLLFSATSISSKTFASGNIATTTKSILKSKKDKKRLHVVDVEGKSGKLDSLATPIQNLLQLSASNSLVTVVDVTGKGKIHSDSDGPSDASGVTKALADSLPQQLLQCVVQTPKEEKDVTLMNMLLQVGFLCCGECICVESSIIDILFVFCVEQGENFGLCE